MMEYIFIAFFYFQINLLHLQPWVCLSDVLINMIVIVIGALDIFVCFHTTICDDTNIYQKHRW